VIYLLGILDKAGHGKTTAARQLIEMFEGEIRPLADPLKRAAQNVFGFSDAQLWGKQADKDATDPRYGFSARWLLQRLGNEGLREEFGEDIHQRALLHGLRRTEAARSPNAPPRLYVVDDVRFPDDARFIASGGPEHVGAVLRLISTDAPPPAGAGSRGHASETTIDDVRPEDIAATVVSSRAQGLEHLRSSVVAALRGPEFERIRAALHPRQGALTEP
jgi:hypothetical protein